MSLAIKFGDSNVNNSVTGVIYFDAVTDYSKQYGGKVTEHPLAAGASITDHYISSNKKYKIKGVISGIDFLSLPLNFKIDGEDIYNKKDYVLPVSIPSLNILDSFLPDVISQFLGTDSPSPIISPQAVKDYRLDIENALEQILHGLYYNEERKKWENRMTLVTLFELNGAEVPSKIIENLAITSFNIEENAESGDALFFDMSLEQITFAKLEKAEAPKPANKSKTARATQEKKNEGNVQTSDAAPQEEERLGVAERLGGI